MNKNATGLILIVLAIGTYFTFTRLKIDEIKVIKGVNDEYQQALTNSERLVKDRDAVLAVYNQIPPDDQERLEKIIPDNVDNVRLIIDVNGIAARHGLAIKNVKTTTPKSSSGDTGGVQSNSVYNTVTLNFDISADYRTFQAFLKDLEASLRILEISRISLKANESGIYDYGLEVKTFWLKQ